MNPGKPYQKHRQAAAEEIGALRIAVITVSDSRTVETDQSGRILRESAEISGHEVVDYQIVPDEPALIESLVSRLLGGPAQVIVLNGGTGISRRDRTFDVISRRLESVIPGFGEIFRMLSYQQIGPAAMLSRAVAGICQGKVLISLPGSPDAVKLGWQKLIEPELRHLVRESGR
jgi:molybdenum cofactor biosynthesis protein B